jgi:hypothetical protein
MPQIQFEAMPNSLTEVHAKQLREFMPRRYDWACFCSRRFVGCSSVLWRKATEKISQVISTFPKTFDGGKNHRKLEGCALWLYSGFLKIICQLV